MTDQIQAERFEDEPGLGEASVRVDGSLAAADRGACIGSWQLQGPIIEPMGDGLGTGIAWFIAGDVNDLQTHMTASVLDDIAETATRCTMQVRSATDDGSAMATLLGQLLARRPTLPVSVYIFLYVSVSVENDSWAERQTKAWANEHPEWIARTSGTYRYADLRIPEARTDLVARVAAMAEALDARLDAPLNPVGIFYDLAFRTTRQDHAAGFDAFLAELRAAMPNRHHTINGLWTKIENVQTQRYAVRQASGAMIEYFGMRPSTGTGNWADDVQPYLDAIEADPVAHWEVYGRWPWDASQWPHTQAQWGLYLYAAYLLAAGPRTSFHYLRTFQVVANAADALYVVPEQRLPLGSPLGPPTASAALRVRVFEQGIVALCRHDQSASGALALARTYYDRTGTAYSKAVTLAPGQALVLFTQIPEEPTMSL